MTSIAAIVPGEPFSPQTWSGCSPFFLEAFQRRGALRAAFGATVGTLEHRLLTALMVYPDIDRWRFRIGVNTIRRKMVTRHGLAQLATLPRGEYDTVLQVGAYYDFTGLPGKRTVSYHDTNLRTLSRYLPAADPRSRIVRAALEYEAGVYSRADMIFTMSRWAADTFVRDLGVDAARVEPVGAGINLAQSPDIRGKRYDEPNILYVGIDFARKGGYVMLEAFERVRAAIPQATLTIIGPRNLSDVPPGVENVGFISKRTEEGRQQILAAYRRAAVFAMPSPVEAFGIAFLEAQASGLPCVGVDFGAMPEIIRDAGAGYVVPPYDAKSLADRLIEMLRDPLLCEQMGANGHRRRESFYTWDGVAERITARLAMMPRRSTHE